jgi:hypothetical protein
MLIRIHQLRDKVHALTRELNKATNELDEEVRNCTHEWANPLRDDTINNFCSGPVNRWVYTCKFCGEMQYSFKDPKEK